MEFEFFEPWHRFLPREGGHVVVFAGGGGKSTLLRACARVYAGEDVPCLVAATAAGAPALDVPRLAEPDLRNGRAGAPGAAVVGLGPAGEASDPATVDAVGAFLPDHVVLVEADACGGLPLSMDGPDRRRWPARTSLAVVVVGAAAAGSPAGEVVAGFRSDGLAGATLADWSTWEWDHTLALLTGAGGVLDRLPPGVPAVLAVTGLDLQPDSVGLFDFVGRAMADRRLPIVLFSGLEEGEPRLRAACRVDGPQGEPGRRPRR